MRRFASLAFVCVLAACGDPTGPPVVASNIVVTAPAPGMRMAVAYLDIANHSGTSIRITGVTSPDYESIEMHETTIEDGIARMSAIPVLEIADGDTATFQRGGKHLMLMQPVGTPESVTLNFHSDDLLLLSVSAEFTTMADQ